MTRSTRTQSSQSAGQSRIGGSSNTLGMSALVNEYCVDRGMFRVCMLAPVDVVRIVSGARTLGKPKIKREAHFSTEPPRRFKVIAPSRLRRADEFAFPTAPVTFSVARRSGRLASSTSKKEMSILKFAFAALSALAV